MQCESWSHSAGTCSLKHAVPRQSLAVDPATISGVKRAATGLVPLQFKTLPLGSVQTAGWLRQQLLLTANGQAGHLELFWDDVMDSVWIGGTADHSGAGHERGPYWLNGVVPLSAHLNATNDTVHTTLNVDLQAQADKWVYYILDNQRPDGWLGPDDGFGGKGNDYWSGWNIAASLMQYADAQRQAGRDAIAALCEKAVLDYVTQVHSRMLSTPFVTWSQVRWQDWVYIIHWLLDSAPQGQEQLLWDAAELTEQCSWDWDAYYSSLGVGTTGAFKGKTMPKLAKSPVGGWTMYDHGVNNAQGTKSCSTWYRQSGNQSAFLQARFKLDMQDKYHGQPHGMFAADECFGGRALNRGIELCAVVEQMYSLQQNFKVTGDLYYLDRLERIAFNSLPGTINPTQWQHQYLQQANEINARFGLRSHVWRTDGADSTGFGVAPNFGCCTANFVQGWAKFASFVVLESPKDGGLVLSMLAPVKVTHRGMSLHVDTHYPFGDTATITASATSPAPLHIRVPGWADKATITIGGQKPLLVANGTLYTVQVSSTETTIRLDLHPEIRVETHWGVSPRMGPSPVEYSPKGALVSSASEDWELQSGATIVSSHLPGADDIRSGGPGESSLAILGHALYGDGHPISRVALDYRYTCGYNCDANVTDGSASLEVQLLDATTHAVLSTLYSSGPLNRFPYPHSYSPSIAVDAPGLNIPNGNPVYLALRFNNSEHNLQIALDAQSGLNVTIEWSHHRAPGPTPKPPSALIPGTAAAAVLRGPLLYTLRLGQKEEVVRTWPTFNNTDVNLDSTSEWNYALMLDDGHPMTFNPSPTGPNTALPFNISGYFATITASARQLPAWVEATNAAEEPPHSPVDCNVISGGCGKETTVILVPYGATNLRMSGLPWIA